MPPSVVIGVLALQGAFAEHQVTVNTLATKSCTKVKSLPNLMSKLVKTPSDLAACDALIIPGGESTTMALLARISGLIEPLREFVKTKPVWGTCAGAILLAESIEGGKKGGQELLGGMSVKIGRNGFGSQIDSFEAPLIWTGDAGNLSKPEEDFVGVFIRAPIVLAVEQDTSRPPVQILAKIHIEIPPVSDDEADLNSVADDPRLIVALRQGHLMLTTFHPELTKDDRFHEYFVLDVVLPFVSMAAPSN
ncbi:putative Sno-type pyridoxine vitamin B6 SNO1 [Serendipita vermifera]|nr:putative Sno-type pyridoxine vitamin B6 SNO1 [Serendipita vermifera]